MNRPFFSIVTATYNAEAVLPRLLGSLVSQTSRDFELVIQDGRSSDNTVAVVETWREKLPSLSLASEKDSGIYDAWNKAVRRVSGEWVLFLGADDRLAGKQVLSEARDALLTCSEEVLFAAGAARMLRPDGELFEDILPRAADAPRTLRSEMPACHTAVFHRASVFSHHMFNSSYRILGDYDLFCRAWTRERQGMDLSLRVTDMAMGGISFSLENQPAAFWESVKIQWKHFSWVPPSRLKILGSSLLVKGLCSLLGKAVAARFIDAARRMRGKPPKWTLLLPGRERTETIDPASVTAVVLNYGGREDTVACLHSLYEMPDRPGRVIVVDNASKDNAVPYILERWGDFTSPIRVTEESAGTGDSAAAILLELPENGGYASGNNAGIRLALQNPACRAVWILNNDTEPTANSLEALCHRLNDVPGAGLAGSTLVYAHARGTVQCAGGFALSRLTGATPAVHGGESLEMVGQLPVKSVEKELEYLCGASILARREAIDVAGFLPEEYFLYYEDAAFCLNARKASYTLAWAPGSIVFHREGGSTGAESADAGRILKRSPLMDYLALRNRIYLIRRYFPYCLPIAVASYAGVMLNRLLRGQARRLPLVLKALFDGVRGKMGKPNALTPAAKEHRILFLTVRADFGGGPEHLWRLLQNMPEGTTAYVACPHEYPYYERYRQLVGDPNITKLPHRTFSIARLWYLRAFCKEKSISILHSHGKGAGLYSRLLALLTGLPCVHTFHGVHMDGYPSVKRAAYRLYERMMSLLTRTGIAVSEGELNQIVERGLMLRAKLRLIPNGVMIPDTRGRGDGFTASPPYTIVTFSRFDYQKNSPFLLDILNALKDMGRLDNFRLTAVGDGTDRQGMLGAVQGTALEGALCCPGASETPHSFFDGALCYLSTSRWEGMPLSVIEAMAHGLPVIASDVVGNRDVVRDGETGFLYPEGNASAAASLLCRLTDEHNLRQTLGEAARNYVIANHDVRTMAKETFKILHGVAMQ